MKIGILTYHRSHNYGALLQAIALKKVLNDMGHEATFIDYWPIYHRHLYAKINFAYLKDLGYRGKYRYIKDCLKNYSYRCQRIANFNSFISEYIEPYVSRMNETYDVIIHGSDQIWRKQPEWKKYNPIYFGKHNIKTKRKISYAASMGQISSNEEDKETLREYLSCLSSISVRETDLKEFVETLGFVCYQHIDPTVLLTGEEWKKTIGIKPENEGKYVLYYHLLPDSFDYDQIESFAREKGLGLKVIYSEAMRKNTVEQITTGDPLVFLHLIYNAAFVFTSSFHGLVFSLLFQKPFYAAFAYNSGRAKSLLDMLGLSDRLLDPCSYVPNDDHEIDFCKVNSVLNDLRKKAIDYLYCSTIQNF